MERAVLKDLEHSGKNGARIETARPPFGNFPIINENDDIDDADDSDSDRSSNSARSDADEEENTNEEKKQRVNIQGAFAAPVFNPSSPSSPQRRLPKKLGKKRRRKQLNRRGIQKRNHHRSRSAREVST